MIEIIAVVAIVILAVIIMIALFSALYYAFDELFKIMD